MERMAPHQMSSMTSMLINVLAINLPLLSLKIMKSNLSTSVIAVDESDWVNIISCSINRDSCFSEATSSVQALAC